ncbi:MAG: flagellar basal body-associated FliL family protein [Deltaproteobacteria bacterium]|nr:flagellar basal body-associated FliL family protein [Deltaproteobacteria bacterium]
MAKDKKEVEEEEKPVEPKKKSILKWIIILSVLLAIIIAGTISGFYFFTKTENKKTAVEKTVALTVWPMDAFIINIAETNGERYLKIVMQLEVSDPSVISELEQLKPRLRDSILDLLTPKTYKELMDLSGKQRLREDIAGRINNILQRGKVTKVYFTDFVIQ